MTRWNHHGPHHLSALVTALLLLALFVLPSGLVQHPAAAATPPPAVSGGARIDEPRSGSGVRGVVRVTGTASVGNFAKYQMYIQRPGSNAFEWKFERNTPVVNGLLWEWSTNPRDYPDGNYVIRMWVVKADGNYDEVNVPVRVENANPPTATPSPSPTGPAVTPTAAASPTPILVSTPVVIGGTLPTATPAAGSGAVAGVTTATTRVAATATPMFGIDVAKIVDPTPWVRSFTTGMALAVAVVAFVIALFIARALLRWRP